MVLSKIDRLAVQFLEVSTDIRLACAGFAVQNLPVHCDGAAMEASALLATLLLAGAQQPTDFGIRTALPGGPLLDLPAPQRAPDSGKSFDLTSVSRLGSQWGRVTSTRRSADHNRAVGGVANSYHLSGRAIDIARGPNIHHTQIEAAYRRAGYALVESLDEGDHSHFAFSTRPMKSGTTVAAGATNWGIRYAPRN